MTNETHAGDFGLETDDFDRAVRLMQLADYSQLKELNHVVVARMRKLDGREQEAAAMTFSIGDLVEFTAKGATHQGSVVKVNRKTVQVKAARADGFGFSVRWNCSPSLLRAM